MVSLNPSPLKSPAPETSHPNRAPAQLPSRITLAESEIRSPINPEPPKNMYARPWLPLYPGAPTIISSKPSPLTSPQSETFHPNLSSTFVPETVEIVAAISPDEFNVIKLNEERINKITQTDVRTSLLSIPC